MQWLLARLRYSWELANLIIQKSFCLSQCYDKLLLDLGAKSHKQWGCTWNRKGRWDVVCKEQAAAALSANWRDASPEEYLRVWFCLKGGWSRTRQVPCSESFFSVFFASDSSTTQARWEDLLPSTKVALNLNAQGLPLSVAQLTEAKLLLSIRGLILQSWEKQKLSSKVSFARNCRTEPLLFTSELFKVGGGSREASQVLTLTPVQWDYLLA